MAVSLQGVKKGSLVHRFITSGKPGNCELCNSYVKKLEAHHISYSPETTIKLCHMCHHKAHFWPNRLSEFERFKLLSKKYKPKDAVKISRDGFLGIQALAKLIAPSRNAFIHAEQLKEQKEIQRNIAKYEKVNHSEKIVKVNKEVDLDFIKRVGRKK